MPLTTDCQQKYDNYSPVPNISVGDMLYMLVVYA